MAVDPMTCRRHAKACLRLAETAKTQHSAPEHGSNLGQACNGTSITRRSFFPSAKKNPALEPGRWPLAPGSRAVSDFGGPSISDIGKNTQGAKPTRGSNERKKPGSANSRSALIFRCG